MNSTTELEKNGIPEILGIVDGFYQEPEKQAGFEERLGRTVTDFIFSKTTKQF